MRCQVDKTSAVVFDRANNWKELSSRVWLLYSSFKTICCSIQASEGEGNGTGLFT